MEVNQRLTQLYEKPVVKDDPFNGRDGTDFLTIAEQKEREDALIKRMENEKNQS